MLKKFVLGGMVVVAALLGNACGDDGSSDSPAGPADSEVTHSSSSDDVVLGSSEKNEAISSSHLSSSSSKKAVSSSSSSNEKSSSSSGKVESSSAKDEKSSSSKKVESSSSTKTEVSSSSVKTEESSSSEKPVESSSSEKVEETSSSVKPDESSSSIVEGSSSAIETSSNSQEVTGVCKTELEDHCTYGSLYDERDGQTYKTVKIGEQWWMAENLKYNDTTQSECHPDDPNCDIYGRFYNREGALNDCPKGWHLPTEKEWLTLSQFVREHSEKGYSGQNLRTDSLWNVSGLGSGYDAFGFSAVPGGGKDLIDGWWILGQNALFWMSDSYKSGSQDCYTYTRLCYKIYKDDSDLIIGKSGGTCVRYKKSKYSVRCLKD